MTVRPKTWLSLFGYASHPGGITTMTSARYQDTPSIIHNQITTARAGQTLA